MKKKKSESIRTQLLGPLLILLVLQAAVIAGTVLFGGVSIKLKKNEINILIFLRKIMEAGDNFTSGNVL